MERTLPLWERAGSLKRGLAGLYFPFTNNTFPPIDAPMERSHAKVLQMHAQVGKQAPNFSLQAYDRTHDGHDGQFRVVNLSDFKGKWVCLYFYPLDFTLVCPTKIVSFNNTVSDFQDRNCELLAASTDSVFSHKGWCDSHQDLGGLKHLMLADTTHELCRAYGVLKEDAGIAYRGVFLIDPNGVVRWLAVHDLGIGRNVNEVLRVLDALQTDKMCPCNWKPGQATID